MNWNSPAIRRLISAALVEDDARRDVTSLALIPRHVKRTALVVAGQDGTVCGLPLARQIFRRVSSHIVCRLFIKEGASVRSGQPLLRLVGPARDLLAGERPALNAIQHLSGIATLTARAVRAARGTRTRVLDTRKTLPGWRALEKYAVRCGGGDNHRQSLGDAVLVKENHLAICRAERMDWAARLARLRRRRPRLPIEIEVQTWKDVADVTAFKPQRVLIDNWPRRELRRLIGRLRREIPGVELELSGGIRVKDVRRLARLGVERISIGELTHSAPAFRCSLDILPS